MYHPAYLFVQHLSYPLIEGLTGFLEDQSILYTLIYLFPEWSTPLVSCETLVKKTSAPSLSSNFWSALQIDVPSLVTQEKPPMALHHFEADTNYYVA